MGSFSGSAAIGAGFRLIAREPLAFLVWCLVYFVLVVAPALWMISQVMPAFMALAQSAAAGVEPAPADMTKLQGLILGLEPVMFLGWTASSAVLASAVFRAALTPDDRSAFFLRLGGRELWVGLVVLVMLVLYFIAVLVMMLPALMIAGAAAATQSNGIVALAPLVMIIGFSVIVWAFMRLSIGPPASFDKGTFLLFESWSLTRGHALRMFGVALALVVIIWFAELVLSIAGVVIFFAANDIEVLSNTWASDPSKAFTGVSPVTWIMLGAFFAVFATWMHVLFWAAWAEIYRGITTTEPAEPAWRTAASAPSG